MSGDDPTLRRAMQLWAEDVPPLPDDFAARVCAEAELRVVAQAWADDAVPALPPDFAKHIAAKVARPGVVALRRRWVWPTLALAAAALMVLVPPWHAAGPTDASVAGPDVADAPPEELAPDNRAEVTHVEVFGAQSYAVISAEEESEAKGNPPVVWITDDPDDQEQQDEPSETVMP